MDALGMAEWIEAHWGDLVVIAGAVTTIGSVVSRFTPSARDDAFWAKAARAVALPGLRRPRMPKGLQ